MSKKMYLPVSFFCDVQLIPIGRLLALRNAPTLRLDNPMSVILDIIAYFLQLYL